MELFLHHHSLLTLKQHLTWALSCHSKKWKVSVLAEVSMQIYSFMHLLNPTKIQMGEALSWWKWKCKSKLFSITTLGSQWFNFRAAERRNVLFIFVMPTRESGQRWCSFLGHPEKPSCTVESYFWRLKPGTCTVMECRNHAAQGARVSFM